MSFIKLIKIVLYTTLITFPVFSQENISEFERLKKITKKSSYIDSISVFSAGELAISKARSNKSNRQEAEIIKIYGDYYYYLADFEKASLYYKKSKKIIKNENYSTVLTSVKLRELLVQIELGNIEDDEQGFIALIENAKIHSDTINIIDGLNNLANNYNQHNNQEDALINYLSALKYANKINNSYRIAFLLNNIGLLEWKNGQTEEALEDFKKGLEIAESIEDPRLAGHLYNNIGLIYNVKEEFETANLYFFKFLTFAKSNNSVKEMGVSYLNIGRSFYNQKQNKIALSYYDSSIQLFDDYHIYYYLPKSHIGRAIVLVDMKKYKKAFEHVNLGMAIAEKYNILIDMASGHKVYHEIAKGENQYEIALKEYVTYKELNDSIEKLNNKKKVAELQIQYDVEKKENELIKQKNRAKLLEKEKELEKIKFRTYVIYSVIIVAAFIVLFFVRHFSILKRKQEEFSQNLIEKIDNERERIAKDLHDDLGQRLSVIKNKLHLYEKENINSNAQLENDVGKVIEQTREISHQLYPAYLAKIGLDRSIAQLLKKVQEDTKLICSYTGINNLDTILSLEEKTHFYRILQECVNNTLKHSSAKALKVSIQCNKNVIKLTYRDNGKGLKGKKVGKGIGFMSMQERVKILNGNMEISANSGKGIKLIFEIHPKKYKV